MRTGAVGSSRRPCPVHGFSAGEVAGWYHDLEGLDQPEEELRFAESGVVLSHRLHCDSQAGDCLIQVAEPISG